MAKKQAGKEPSAPKYVVSIVVPTYKESKNIELLTRRIFQTLAKCPEIQAQLFLVEDDSGEDTLETKRIVDRLSKDFPIRLRIRTPNQGKGLSSAVLLGLRETTSEYLVVMDADLQHEPESLPDLLAPVLSGQAEFAIGSRNALGAETSESWPLVRRVISWGATALARPLTSCGDPMSGFFALPRTTLDRAKYLNPTGYKIGLELMVRCRVKEVIEVPIQFRDREFGESKLTMKQNILYVQHLARLYWFAYPGLVVVLLFAIALACVLSLWLCNQVYLHVTAM
ncbi:hypothetical protein BASA81_005136 [Batrachochytrium salamandrivorans]|nr:hypothetical protein BASA81_005136 [Batrachochytrium salamandrivorans]